MRRNLPTTYLWREIVENANQGVLVLNESNLVIYGNDEAAQLLGYRPRDLLGLDLNDILSLFYADRLDFKRLATALSGNSEETAAQFEVATTDRRLYIRPIQRELDDSNVTILYINPVDKWQSELVAEAVLSETMRGNLEMSFSALETLLMRLTFEKEQDATIQPFEIESLVTIMRDGIENTLSLWQQMEKFYYTSQADAEIESGSSDIFNVLASVMDAREIRSYHPVIEVQIPPGLPSVTATKAMLSMALANLLDGVTERLSSQDVLVVTAHADRRHVYIKAAAQIFNGQSRLPDGYAIDMLPLAMTEQIVVQCGGRLWSESDPDSLLLMLPIAST